MGHLREKPERLAEKLLSIREDLKLSQNELIRYLQLEGKLLREDISKFERGVREPTLKTLLSYARAVGISTDILIDDELDLPERLSTNEKGEINQSLESDNHSFTRKLDKGKIKR